MDLASALSGKPCQTPPLPLKGAKRKYYAVRPASKDMNPSLPDYVEPGVFLVYEKAKAAVNGTAIKNGAPADVDVYDDFEGALGIAPAKKLSQRP